MVKKKTEKHLMRSHYLGRIYYGAVDEDGVMAENKIDLTTDFYRCVLDCFLPPSKKPEGHRLKDGDGRIFKITVEQTDGLPFPERWD